MYCFFLISAILKVALACQQETSLSDSYKIVGGEETTIEKHPHQVSIRQSYYTPIYGQHGCGGSLIKYNVVLTAAHCMSLSFDQYSVKAGSKFVANDGEVLPILRYLNHPRYSFFEYDYDVSIVVLNGSFQEGPKIKIIQIIPQHVALPVATMATVTGWGRVFESVSESLSEILRQVEVPKVEYKVCKDIYTKLLEKLEDRMTCYGTPEGGKDACQGDSGGPLVAKTYLIGIVSWGRGCGRPNVPGIYTNLKNHEIRKFIFSNWKKY